jgi:hypothetical protein
MLKDVRDLALSISAWIVIVVIAIGIVASLWSKYRFNVVIVAGLGVFCLALVERGVPQRFLQESRTSRFVNFVNAERSGRLTARVHGRGADYDYTFVASSISARVTGNSPQLDISIQLPDEFDAALREVQRRGRSGS